MGGNWAVAAVHELWPRSGRPVGTGETMQGQESFEASCRNNSPEVLLQCQIASIYRV